MVVLKKKSGLYSTIWVPKYVPFCHQSFDEAKWVSFIQLQFIFLLAYPWWTFRQRHMSSNSEAERSHNAGFTVWRFLLDGKIKINSKWQIKERISFPLWDESTSLSVIADSPMSEGNTERDGGRGFLFRPCPGLDSTCG